MFKRKQLKFSGEKLVYMGWKFNRKLIEQFVNDLGIKNKIKIRVYTSGHSELFGEAFYINKKHVILISKYLDWHQASKTLLHELYHCHQRESFSTEDDFAIAYQNAGGSSLTAKTWEEYWNNPFEIAARKFAEENQWFAVCRWKY